MKSMKVFYLCFVLINLLTFSLTHFETAFNQQISNDDSYNLSWSINSEEGLIKFDLDVKTKGWIGLGISPTGLMSNSDMYIGYIQLDGKAIVNDRFALERALPLLDTAIGGKDDITDINGSYKNERSYISFTRKLVTGDKYDIDIKRGEIYNLIFSYRNQGNPETEGTYLVHSGTFQKQLILYPKSNQNTNIQTLDDKYKDYTDIKQMDITFDKTAIPNEATGYVCKLFNVNKMINEVNKSDKKDTSYHAIGFEPIIDNEAYVHHIVILACDYKNVYYSDQIFRCEESPPDCMQNMIGWGVGQKTFEFPPEAGMMWGTFESYFVVLQIHYNNPTKVINQVDSSGFSIFYTSKLRQYDMGVSFLGQLNIRDVKIPPNTKNTQLSYKCPKKCLNDIPSEGYNIVLTAYHQHRLGRKIRAVITKPDGTVDDTTFREDNYDFEHQKWVINNPPYKVLPGSSFETTCEWDSSGIDSYTLGGPGTDNEMCVVFFYYYPKENGVQYCFEGKTEKDDICIFNKKVDRVELGWAANSTYLNRSLILVITYLALSYIIM